MVDSRHAGRGPEALYAAVNDAIMWPAARRGGNRYDLTRVWSGFNPAVINHVIDVQQFSKRPLRDQAWVTGSH